MHSFCMAFYWVVCFKIPQCHSQLTTCMHPQGCAKQAHPSVFSRFMCGRARIASFTSFHFNNYSSPYQTSKKKVTQVGEREYKPVQYYTVSDEIELKPYCRASVILKFELFIFYRTYQRTRIVLYEVEVWVNMNWTLTISVWSTWSNRMKRRQNTDVVFTWADHIGDRSFLPKYYSHKLLESLQHGENCYKRESFTRRSEVVGLLKNISTEARV